VADGSTGRRTKAATSSRRPATSSRSTKSSSRRLGSAPKAAATPATPDRSAGPKRAGRTKGPADTAAAAQAAEGAAADDPLVVALDVWRAVVAALEQARYHEIGPAYAKLSTLLVQQRTAELLSDPGDRAEWVELSRTAQEAVTLLEPVMTAARQLVALPSRIDVDRGTTEAPRGARNTPAGRPARRRTPKK